MKKTLIIIVIIISVVLILSGALLSLDLGQMPTQQQYALKEYGRIETCYNEDCSSKDIDVYVSISHDYKSDKLQEKIKSFNNQIQKDYKEAISSTTTDGSCSEVAPYAKNSIRYIYDAQSYTNDQFINVSLIKTKINICTKAEVPYQRKSYFYDYKNDKFYTQEEIMRLNNITEEKIYESIKRNNDVLMKLENIKVATKDNYDFVLHYDVKGELYAAYYAEEINNYLETAIK